MHRGGIHAPNKTPNDDLKYKTIHNVEIQQKRNMESHLYSRMAMGLLLLPIGITILRILIELIGIWLINSTGQIISKISIGNGVNRPNF